MIEEQYYDYLYQALASNKLMSDSNIWRNNLESAVSFLGIKKSYIERLKKDYSAQFSEVILINSTKNVLLCRCMQIPISKELCAASVYFSLLGCVLDFCLDSGNADLRLEGIEKLSWKKCKAFFQDFDSEKSTEDVIDELFMEVGIGMQIVFKNNPTLYQYLLKLINKAAVSEVIVAENNQKIEGDLIYNKSVLFVEIALLLAIGNKTDLEEKDYRILEKIGLLYAYIDDLIDIYEDIETNQANIFVNKLCSGESYKLVIDSSVQQLNKLIDEIRRYMGNQLADFLRNEISDWIFTNTELTRRKNESRG